MKVTIVYGPQGCGKTKNQEKIKRLLGCDHAMDFHDLRGFSRKSLPYNHLLLFDLVPSAAKKVFPAAKVVEFSSLKIRG